MLNLNKADNTRSLIHKEVGAVKNAAAASSADLMV